MERSGAELIVEALRREGVEVVFGYPGGAVIPIFDALYSAPDIRVVLTRHEQAAVHAADGYARATRKTGVCIATSGPGATNTVTGLATARFDSVPLVCVTGQVARALIGNDAFQEADTIGITQPVTKHNYLVKRREDLGDTLKRSFTIASTGRPGPVLVDIPKDVQIERFDDEYPSEVSFRSYKPKAEIDDTQVRSLADALNGSSRPLFFIGGGMVIAEAAQTLRRIEAVTGIPSVTSLMGIGVLDSNDPLNLGMIGMHGSIAANKALTRCDLLVGLGVRFDDRATGDTARFAPDARIAHVDIDPSSIGRNVRVDLPVVGDLGAVLEALQPLLKARGLATWHAELEDFKAYSRKVEQEAAEAFHAAAGFAAAPDSPPSPKEVLDIVGETFPDAIVSTEVGQNQMWAAQHLRFSRPRRWLTSGGLGTMGYGFPAGMGAKVGNPDDPVVVVAGDGSFQMNIQELATCVQEDIPVIVVILNNGYLGMVRQWQELFYERRYSSTCMRTRRACAKGCASPGEGCPPYTPDFAAIAQAYGALGLRAENVKELRAALAAAKAADHPAVIDCVIGREENVWPMVAPGKGNDQMLFKGVSV